jgi:hypothetical protein
MTTENVLRLDDYRKRPTLPEPPREGGPPTVAEAIEVCLQHPEVLTTWEEGFLASIRRVPRLTPKQLTELQRIFDKVCGAAEYWAP